MHGIPVRRKARLEFPMPCCECRQCAYQSVTLRFPSRFLSISRRQSLRRTRAHRVSSSWILSYRFLVFRLLPQSPHLLRYLLPGRQMQQPPVSLGPLWATRARTDGSLMWNPQERQHLLLHSQSLAEKSRKRLVKPPPPCNHSNFQSPSTHLLSPPPPLKTRP